MDTDPPSHVSQDQTSTLSDPSDASANVIMLTDTASSAVSNEPPRTIVIVVSLYDSCDNTNQSPDRIYFRKLEESRPPTWGLSGDDELWEFHLFVLSLIKRILHADVTTKHILSSFDDAGDDAGASGDLRAHLKYHDWIGLKLVEHALDDEKVKRFLLEDVEDVEDVIDALAQRGVTFLPATDTDRPYSWNLEVKVTDAREVSDVWGRYKDMCMDAMDTTTTVKATVHLTEGAPPKGPLPATFDLTVVVVGVQVTSTWESVLEEIKAKVEDELDKVTRKQTESTAPAL